MCQYFEKEWVSGDGVDFRTIKNSKNRAGKWGVTPK